MILVSYEYSEYDPLVNFMKCEWVPENFVVLRPSGFVEFEAVFQGHKTHFIFWMDPNIRHKLIEETLRLHPDHAKNSSSPHPDYSTRFLQQPPRSRLGQRTVKCHDI